MTSPYCITIDDVKTAAGRIAGVAHRTPVLTCSSLNGLSKGRHLFFKVEALQKTGSFKFRGALNAVKEELERRKKADNDTALHVLTHSSGNHAQALALAAKLAGGSATTGSTAASTNVQATIVMPSNTPTVKRNAVQDFGATIVMVEPTNKARREKAEEIRQNTGASFIHPSEDPRVIAGQGTVCLEMLEQVQELTDKPLDVVIIPVGGGGLASGNIITLRSVLGDKVKIVLAEPAKLDDAKRSFEAKELLPHDPSNNLDSVADGLKTTLGPNTWPIIRDKADDILTVTEDEILLATKLIWERLKICIEPSAGVGIAACLGEEFQAKYPTQEYSNVGIILCGGNVDIVKISKKIEEAVARQSA
ncbi:L-threo-3-hydroxyaspartate ammonia-lyase [Seminavis robusta]|uniref:L-threo-3-hydroxyaspartate ammonia-lyase n=1 Tax=Seminavis robusta TaxID=568900 RepID=A0A9N8E0J0_9STRA|nr:L-threo-3-hydroxyaspartate ammonia-lyase [Seminavis robusta]|eukprot:Sro527_g160670.1 L-threo-3-hydroxyaspartate ammonia-lyase (363) ;mRNA; f:33008-34267